MRRPRRDTSREPGGCAGRGVAIEQVSVLLGHASVKITEKHYSPWVQARQAQAEAAIARALVADPLAMMMSAAPERAQ